MTVSGHQSEVYKNPQYYALGYRWNTEAECDFIEAALKAHGPEAAKRLVDIGCGTGRHLFELTRRGYAVTGIDPTAEMVAYVKEQSAKVGPTVSVREGDLMNLQLSGQYDAAYCFMDTFRFLLSNEDITDHLQEVAAHLNPGGLYLTDFWVPRQYDQIGNEVHQWEQTEGDTTVRVFYLQHPETVDPIHQTFEDELVFEVHEGEDVQEIRGGRTRTRIILPQEYRALVETTGAFELVSMHGEWDLQKPLDFESLSWRLITVLRKR